MLYAILLGAIQGLTEFLPVSSSAHLILFSYFFAGQELPLALNVALHVGTALAVLIYFWRDWWLMVIEFYQSLSQPHKINAVTSSLLFKIIIGSIPAAVIGLLWEDKIEEIFHHPVMVILPLALVGVLLWRLDIVFPQPKKLTDLSLRDAFIIGLGQALALIPGVSRSGATILFGRLRKIDRVSVTRFSFLLGTPAIGGAAVLKYQEIISSLHDPMFFQGVLSSAVVGCMAIGFFMRFVQRFNFAVFAYYRLGLALFLFVLFLSGNL